MIKSNSNKSFAFKVLDYFANNIVYLEYLFFLLLGFTIATVFFVAVLIHSFSYSSPLGDLLDSCNSVLLRKL